MNTLNAIKNVENDINKRTEDLNRVTNEKEICKYKSRELKAKLAAEEDEYQTAVKDFNEKKDIMESYRVRMEAAKAKMEAAKAKMEAVYEKKTQTHKKNQSCVGDYNRLIRGGNYFRDIIQKKEVDLRVMRESLELEQKIYASRKEEKQVVKKGKKNGDSDTLLQKIQKMPEDVMLLIRGYLPFDVRVSLIKDRFNSVMNKCKGAKSVLNNDSMGANAPELFISLLDYAGTCPEFLPLLSREEARLQIPSLTPIGSEWKVYTYCQPTRIYSNGNPIDTVVKNKINWLVELAKAGNPEFAYKVMKTAIVICSSLRKYTPKYNVNAKRQLTLQDLPAEYR
jgi:hypothetical protein